ncbi:MAG: hypothetical protein RLY30_587 [Pseudomonadota bacterium]|jgi:hypothetical protein
MNHSQWWSRFQTCVEGLSLDRLEELGQFYAPDAQFQDPFQAVQGREAILRCYRSMFTGLHEPRFSALAYAGQGPNDPVAVRWVFGFSLRPQSASTQIPGTSWLQFDAQGLIVLHEDHWDASRLIDAFPWVGGVTRLVKKQIAKHAQSH